jgi:hypothetical protein
MKFDQRKRGKGWGGGLKFFEKLPIRWSEPESSGKGGEEAITPRMELAGKPATWLERNLRARIAQKIRIREDEKWDSGSIPTLQL